MVAAVRDGESLRAVARRFVVRLATVQRWVDRAAGQPLGAVDWSDHSHRPQHTHRTPPEVDAAVLALRHELRATSALGEFGAAAIQRALAENTILPLPSVRTIGRILERHGAFDAPRRKRRPAPPIGWYLPDVAGGTAEVDSFDIVDGLVIEGGPQVEVLNGVSLLGGLVVSWPGTGVTAMSVVRCMAEHWQAVGLPVYAQFDNDTRFQGSHQWADSLGRVIRVCLQLKVTPVFAPPRETGFQAAIESYNGRWQGKVWARFHHASLEALEERSQAYVAANRTRRAPRQEAAPLRRVWPAQTTVNLQTPLAGSIIYLRRTSDRSTVSVLGHTWQLDGPWANRLVRCEVDLTRDVMNVYGLSRRTPDQHPLLQAFAYHFPRRPFRE
jgi:Homeodomain-like domain